MKGSYKENMMEGYRAFEHLSAATRTTLRCGHGRPKDICGECFPTQTAPRTPSAADRERVAAANAFADLHRDTTVIDRDPEFDQTAKTEPVIIGAGADRSVSPAILEFRIQELQEENRVLRSNALNCRHCDGRHYHASSCEYSPASIVLAELDEERRKHGETIEKLIVAEKRIAGFERMAAGLAAKIDEFERGFQAVTGATAAEFAAAKAVKPHEFDPNRCYRPCTTPLGIAACILDSNHEGMCEGA